MKISILWSFRTPYSKCVKQNVKNRQDGEIFTNNWHVFSYCWCVALGGFAINVCFAVFVWQLEQMRNELMQERASRQDVECDKISLERQVKTAPSVSDRCLKPPVIGSYSSPPLQTVTFFTFNYIFFFLFCVKNKDLKSRIAHLEGSHKPSKEGLVVQLENRIQELEERLEGEER